MFASPKLCMICPSKLVLIIRPLRVADVCTTVQNDVCELHITTPEVVIAALNINAVYMFVLEWPNKVQWASTWC